VLYPIQIVVWCLEKFLGLL